MPGFETLASRLERHHIGWTMWEYSDSFGVAIRKNGKAVREEETVQTLGLKDR